MDVRKLRILGFVCFSSYLLGYNSYAVSEDWVNLQLDRFHSNSKAFINDQENVRKVDPETLEALPVRPLFSPASISNSDFIFQKNFERMKSEDFRAHAGRSNIQASDLPENLVDKFEFDTLQGMEGAKLTSAQLDEQPWSSYYWATYKGGIANRYADRSFPKSYLEIENYLGESAASSLDLLSPAEKYDLLVGDPNKTLTHSILESGKKYLKEDGTIETWMGICHGWAPASFMFDRPKNAIKLLAADHMTQITFYPEDIKALASLLWANAAPATRLIGGRCNEKEPKQDANGRVLSQDCFDTNPGTWHQSVVNQIGVAKRSLVMDASFDYEVWNQPIYAYEYSYFNPETRKSVNTLKEAMIKLNEFTTDPFAAFRSPQARYFVGVLMKLAYIGEVMPKARLKDGPAQDRRVAVRYFYDLELDSSLKIIGGEWYHKQHPDFLWVPEPGSRPVSQGDVLIPSDAPWNGENPIPKTWVRAAQEASKYTQPLSAVVEELVFRSKMNQ